jgi:7-cyano-7-deazaguanine synthase
MTLEEGREVHALTIDYGQRHRKEIEAAKNVAKHYGVASHKILRFDLTAIGGSALTDERIRVPQRRTAAEIGTGIPVTYVPARNTIFLGFALAYAEALDADEIVIAANYLDASGYPDCRPEYYGAFREVARLGTRRGVEGRPVRIVTPVISMTKADIVRKGAELGVPWKLTWSCYLGGEKACGTCDSCQLRLKGFREAGVKDPLPYARRAQTL